MSFIVTHLLGQDRRDPALDTLVALLDELNDADDEHFEVSVRDESGWCLSVSASGNVVWENVEDDGHRPRHLRGISRVRVLELFQAVASGHLDIVERENWLPGYPR